jgi:hypothetical protein
MGFVPASWILVALLVLWVLSIAFAVWWHHALKNKQRYRVDTHAI